MSSTHFGLLGCFFFLFFCCGLVVAVVVVVADGGGGGGGSCGWLLKFVVDVFIIILMSYLYYFNQIAKNIDPLSVRLGSNENYKLFHYSAYFCYYL